MARKQTKSTNGFLTAMVVLLVLACVAVGVLGWQSEGWQNWEKFKSDGNTTEAEIETPGDMLEFEIQNSAHVMLAMSTATTASEDATSVSKTLTATVLPEDAPDKTVDWSVEWLVPIEGENVIDYITVTPTADGSNIATVSCHKGFEGASAYVTVTTRVGGFSASCLITYEGAPEHLFAVYNGVEYSYDNCIALNAGEAHSISLKLVNTIGDVGSKYGKFEITSIGGQGRFNAKKAYLVNGVEQKSETIVINLAEPKFTLYGSGGEGSGGEVIIDIGEFLSVEIKENTLTVNCLKNELSYKYPSVTPRTGTRVTYDSAYVDPRSGGVADECYFLIGVKDTVSGKSLLLKFDIISTVEAVSMDHTQLVF